MPGYYVVTCDLYGYNAETCSYLVYLDLMSNPAALNTDFVLTGAATGIVDDPEPDGRIMISGNYPNPFNSRTLIRLYSDRSEVVSSRISVFNALGQMVGAKIVCINPGDNLIEWGSADFRGNVSSGAYFYHFDGFGHTYRMILLK